MDSVDSGCQKVALTLAGEVSGMWWCFCISTHCVWPQTSLGKLSRFHVFSSGNGNHTCSNSLQQITFKMIFPQKYPLSSFFCCCLGWVLGVFCLVGQFYYFCFPGLLSSVVNNCTMKEITWFKELRICTTCCQSFREGFSGTKYLKLGNGSMIPNTYINLVLLYCVNI